MKTFWKHLLQSTNPTLNCSRQDNEPIEPSNIVEIVTETRHKVCDAFETSFACVYCGLMATRISESHHISVALLKCFVVWILWLYTRESCVSVFITEILSSTTGYIYAKTRFAMYIGQLGKQNNFLTKKTNLIWSRNRRRTKKIQPFGATLFLFYLVEVEHKFHFIALISVFVVWVNGILSTQGLIQPF